jgi:DNA-binding NarL/FixJ family response regulator
MGGKKTENKKLKHKVLVVDDHPIVRQGLTQLINQESDFIVCGDAGDIPQALKAINDCKPDVIIVDISLGHTSGIRLIEDLSHNYPNLSILALSMHDESIYAERCLKAGAKGYIMKQEPPEKVVSALRKILDGDIYISDKLGTKLLHKFVTKKADASGSPVELLSNRELEVFQLVGQGLKTRKIAEELNLSVKTVETYIDHIKKKMNFDDSRDLFLHAVQWSMNEKIQ